MAGGKSFDSILFDVYEPIGLLSTKPVKERLRKDLEEHRRQLWLFQRLQFGLLIVLTLVAVIALTVDLSIGNSVRIGMLTTAGVSIPTLLALLRKNLQEWTRINLFLILLMNSTEKQAKIILRNYFESSLGAEEGKEKEEA